MTSSVLHMIQQFLPLVPRKEKKRFWALLALAMIMALTELAITGLVALLAAIFGSPETVLNYSPVLWLRGRFGFGFSSDPRLLALAVLCAILLAIGLKNMLAVMQQRQLSIFSESVGAAARIHVFRFYQRAPYLWLQEKGLADLAFGWGAATQLSNVMSVTLQIGTGILMLATLFVGLISASPLPSLMFLAVLGFGGGGILSITRRAISRCAKAVFTAEYHATKIYFLAIHSLKEMRLYGRENQVFATFCEKMTNLIATKSAQQTVARLPVCCLEILGFSTLVGIMMFLIFVQDAGMGRISGIMGLLAATAWRSLPVANRLMDSISSFRGCLPYLQKVQELLSQEKAFEKELLPLTDSPIALPFSRHVEFEKVSFRYPGATEDTIHDFSMTIRAGSMVGIVGLSGAGKSTLVNMLAGLLSPSFGRILIDGMPLSKENVAAWVTQIGYVAQAPYLLDAPLAENVALSRWGEPIDRDRVFECCRMAALNFVDDLENGIDTVLGERGARLSGGQAQRVAIARALYGNPRLIIFDEATSSLDMKNEKAIHETILSLREHVTVVIIAHRLSTVKGCDTLAWLDKGRVVRVGNVDDVLPEYRKALEATKEMAEPEERMS